MPEKWVVGCTNPISEIRASVAARIDEKERKMSETLTTGTLLIEEGVVFPESLQIESDPYSNGWRIVKELDGPASTWPMKSVPARWLLIERNRFPRHSTRF